MSDQKELVSDAVPEWQLELDKVGLLRRLLLARKWYKGDWWFVLISGIMLLFIITLGIFPQWFAPHDPREEVGPSLLAPGEETPSFTVLVEETSEAVTFSDISERKNKVGYLMGSQATQALRDTLDRLNTEAEEEGSDITYQPRGGRY